MRARPVVVFACRRPAPEYDVTLPDHRPEITVRAPRQEGDGFGLHTLPRLLHPDAGLDVEPLGGDPFDPAEEDGVGVAEAIGHADTLIAVAGGANTRGKEERQKGQQHSAQYHCHLTSPLLRGLTLGITRRPERLSKHDKQRVGGRVHAVVSWRAPIHETPRSNSAILGFSAPRKA